MAPTKEAGVATKTKKAAATKTRSTKNDVKEALVDKALKKRYQDALSRYRAATTAETARWDERYEVLDEIINSDPPYYLAGGYATVREFLKAEAPNETERGARMGIRVAVHFDASDERQYGISNLDALVSYLEAEAGGPLGRAKIHPERQTIRVKQGKGTKPIAFSEATRAQIQAAARLALGKSGGSGAKVPPVVATLKKALGQAGLGDIAVSLRGGKVTLSGIAVESMAELGKVLKGVKG